jgi:hypothetical protein
MKRMQNVECRVKSLIAIFVLTFLTLNSALLTPAYAHVLRTDNPIGAVLHIDPEDNPVVGQPANIFFEFKDKENEFKIENCDCTFFVLENGKEIFSQGLNTTVITYTFPAKNTYKLKVTGKPKQLDEFEDFSLEYDVVVSREIEVVHKESPNWFSARVAPFLGGLILGLLLIFSFVKRILGGNKK